MAEESDADYVRRTIGQRLAPKMPDISAWIPRAVEPAPLHLPKNPNWPSEIHKSLVRWISEYEAKLDPDHEVGVRLVSFGQTVQFYLESIVYSDSPLMVFKGCTIGEDPQPVELIQHVSQISVLLMKLPKMKPEGPPRRIGFLGEAEAATPVAAAPAAGTTGGQAK